MADERAWQDADAAVINDFVRAVNGGRRFYEMPVPPDAGGPAATSKPLVAPQTSDPYSYTVIDATADAVPERRRSGRIERRPIDLWTVRDALLFRAGNAVAVWDANGTIVPQASGRGSAPLGLLIDDVVRARPPTHVAGAAILLADSSDGGNFCHWTADHFTRAALYVGHVPTSTTALIVRGDRSFVRASLEAIDDLHAGVVELRQHPLVRVDELHVASSVGAAYQHPAQRGASWAIEFLRQRLLSSRPPAGERRIVVSRRDADGRRVHNEEELTSSLAAEGFETVELGRLSVGEQARLFASATYIVAPHGAGLTNIVFARAGTRLLELFSPTYAIASFRVLAGVLGLDYTAMTGGLQPSPTGRPTKDDIVVDVDAVRRWLDQPAGSTAEEGPLASRS